MTLEGHLHAPLMCFPKCVTELRRFRDRIGDGLFHEHRHAVPDERQTVPYVILGPRRDDDPVEPRVRGHLLRRGELGKGVGATEVGDELHGSRQHRPVPIADRRELDLAAGVHAHQVLDVHLAHASDAESAQFQSRSRQASV